MSSPNNTRRAARLAAVAVLALGLSACFRPLYGPTASGAPMADVLASIEVEPAVIAAVGQERLGHYLRSELVYDLNGSGQPQPKRYRLTLNASESAVTPLISSTTGRAESATINGTVVYTLSTFDGSKVLTTGRAVGAATYDRNPQRYANIRAAREAEIRLGKLLAEQIKIRIASVLATNPVP